MNRAERRALARQMVRRDLDGRSTQFARAHFAKTLPGGSLYQAPPEETTEIIAEDESGTTVEKRRSGLLAIRSRLGR